MATCDPNQFSDFFLPGPPLKGNVPINENRPVQATGSSAFVVAGKASRSCAFVGTATNSGTISVQLSGIYVPIKASVEISFGQPASTVTTALVTAINGVFNNFIATAALGSPNTGNTGVITLEALDIGSVGNNVKFNWNSTVTGIGISPGLNTDVFLTGGFDQGQSPNTALNINSSAGVVTTDTKSQQAQYESAVANITKVLDQAQNTMSQRIIPAWDGLTGLVNFFDAANAGKFASFQDELLQANGALQGFKNLVTLFDQDPVFNKTLTDGLNYLNDHGIQPIASWVASVNALSRFNTSGIDLSNSDGSLSALADVVNNTLDGIGKLVPPWSAATGGLKSWFAGVSNSWNNIVKINDQVDQVIKDATAMVLAAQQLLLSACEAIPAIVAQMKKLLNDIFAFFKNLLNFHFNFDLFKGFHFKFPSLPDFLHLADWQGLYSALDGFGGVFAKCASALVGNGVPNFNALSEGMSALSTIESKFIAGTVGIGNITHGIPTALDPQLALFQTTSSILGMAPNPTTITPEVSGALAGAAGGVASTNTDPTKLSTGSIDLLTVNLIQPTTDPNGLGGMPGPQQSIEGSTAVTGDLFGTLAAANILGTLISDTAAAMFKLGHDATEQDGKDALAMFLSATSQAMAIRNAALNHTLDPDSLANAAATYWACKNAEDHVSPSPNSSTDLGAKAPLSTPAGGGTGTPLAAATLNGNNATPGGLTQDPVGNGLPTNYLDDAIKVLVNSYADPNVLILDYPSLPYFFLLQIQQDLEDYREIKVLDNKFAAIFADPTLLQAELTLLSKSRQQFVEAHSPYIWLARGCEILASYLDANNKPMSLSSLIQGMLIHDPRNLLPLADWLNELPVIDFEVPIAFNLLSQEEAFANESYQYVLEHRRFDFVALLTKLRTNADTIGHFLSFEYCLVLATFVLMNRMTAMLQQTGTTPADVALVAAEAKKYVAAMTNGQDFIPMLDALAGGT